MPIPNATKTAYFNGSIDLANDTIRIALISDATGYTFDQDTHDFVSDVLDDGTTAEEFSGSSGYTGPSDRKTLTTSTSTDDTDDEAVFDADNVSWSNVDGTNDIQGYLIYQQVGGDDTTPGDDRIIQVVDDSDNADLPQTVNGSEIQIQFDAEGIVNST